MKNLKNIKIDEEIHNQLKHHCQEEGIKLGKLVEKLIAKHLKEKDND